MKAADIPDELFLRGVRELRQVPLVHGHEDYGWVMRWDLDTWLADQLGVDMPWKVTLAKARKLIKRGLLDGCACGCRGDFVIPGEKPSPEEKAGPRMSLGIYLQTAMRPLDRN